MSACLRLESFSPRPARIVAAPEVTLTQADLNAARAAGFDEGCLAAFDADRLQLAEAIGAMAEALSRDDARRDAEAVQWRATIAGLLRAVLARIAPRMRAAAATDAILQEIASLSRMVSAPALRVTCDPATADLLRPAMDAAGLGGIVVDIAEGCPTIHADCGVMAIDMDGLADRLALLLDELETGANDGQD